MKREIEIKLSALENNVSDWLYSYHYGRATYFDPKEVKDLFSRFKALVITLRTKHPSFFADLPERDIKPSKTTDYEGRGYIHRKFLEILLMDIKYCLHILSGITYTNLTSMEITREGLFFSGQQFDAIQIIANIILSAKKNIIIVDNYIGEKVLSLITSKDSNVEVKILTRKVQAALKTQAKDFNKQYGGLQIRTTKEFHDRFIVIDNSDFYHFGASIKDLGTKGFMFSRIEEPEIIRSLSLKISQEWENAKVEIGI